jgi:DNA (cytosine-5)-methyltransferase 1
LKKFARPIVMDVGGVWGREPRPVSDPLATQTTRQTAALIVPPFITSQHENADGTATRVKGIDDPLPCVTTFNNEHQLVVPPFLSAYYGNGGEHTTDEPLATVTTHDRHGLVVPPFVTEFYGTAIGREVNAPLSTVMGNPHHGVVLPPFMTVFKTVKTPDGTESLRLKALDEPLTTLVASTSQHGLVVPPPLADSDWQAIYEHSGFRMLEPEELKRGMSFPDEYVILGNKREQVRQVGNAVCCAVAEAIARRCVESLR